MTTDKPPKPPEWTVVENDGHSAVLETGKPMASARKIIRRSKNVTVKEFVDSLKPGSPADPATVYSIENPT